jgi:hypothetical protein
MKDKPRVLTTDDLASFERSTTRAMTIVLGLLAEAVGSQKLAYHFGAALSAAEQQQPDPTRDRLLDAAFRLVLTKAMHHAPDDPLLRNLAATLRARQTKH